MGGGRRALSSFACILIVLGFPAYLSAAAVISEDVPVPGGSAAVAQALGIDPAPDRARFVNEVTRLVYESSEVRNPAVAAFLQAIRQPGRKKTGTVTLPDGAADIVPIPLTTALWSDAIFHRKVPRDAIVVAIVADRQAALLCHGLSELDDDTLEFFASHPDLLSRLYERDAPVFAAFGGSIRIQNNRVVPPGGAGAVALWEAAAGEKVERADRFVQALLNANEGRLAYLYDLSARLDPPRRNFVLGTWMPEPARSERFRLLTSSGLNAIREWRVRLLPFGRASYDFGMAVVRLNVAADGTPLPPISRGMWAHVFGVGDPSDEQPVDAAWILEYVLSTDVRQRGDRLDQIAFAQRVFGPQRTAPADLLPVLKAMPRFRALVLTFERAGFRNAETYAAVVRHASRLSGLDGRRGYVAQAQFQGALAIVTRMMNVRSIDIATGERLVASLVALPVTDGYAGGVARWMRETLHPVLPAAHDVESALVAGLSGPAPGAAAPRVNWEGQLYRLDLAAAERQRLMRVREKQHAPPFDIPLQMAEAARLLATEKITVDDVQDAATQFQALATDMPERSREDEVENLPGGVAPPPQSHELLRRAAEELASAAKSQDLKKAARVAGPVVEIADDLLARDLLSMAYALSIGDPDGTVLLANDVSQRHDFGFSARDLETRARIVWAIPREDVAPGVPWHVSGSLLALDAGLPTLALRRVATDHALEAPKLTNNTRDTLATSVALLDPYALHDVDRDAIADAIERGRGQVLAASDARALDGIAAELDLEESWRRALRWTLAHEPERLVSMFSMTQFLVLGGADLSTLDAWGMAVIPATGCLCSRLFPPRAARVFAGRPQLGLAGAMLPDLNLRIAVVLKELGLPAPLARVILSGAMQDFIDEVRPTDDGDWLSQARTAQALSRERIEDYIAAATATGPLMPEPNRTPQAVK